MKLIYCRACGDIVALSPHRRRFCWCTKSSGQYRPDGWHADAYGKAIMLGFGNEQALENGLNMPEPKIDPKTGEYPNSAYMVFTIFVQPPWHPQAHYHEEPDG